MKNRLRVLRAERDWSQADLAERVQVSRQTINGSTAKLAFCAPGSSCPHAQTAPGHSEFCGTAINAIENGKYDPSLPLAFRLARLFERTVEEVFQVDDEH